MSTLYLTSKGFLSRKTCFNDHYTENSCAIEIGNMIVILLLYVANNIRGKTYNKGVAEFLSFTATKSQPTVKRLLSS